MKLMRSSLALAIIISCSISIFAAEIIIDTKSTTVLDAFKPSNLHHDEDLSIEEFFPALQTAPSHNFKANTKPNRNLDSDDDDGSAMLLLADEAALQMLAYVDSMIVMRSLVHECMAQKQKIATTKITNQSHLNKLAHNASSYKKAQKQFDIDVDTLKQNYAALKSHFAEANINALINITSFGDKAKDALARCASDNCVDDVADMMLAQLRFGQEINTMKPKRINVANNYLRVALLNLYIDLLANVDSKEGYKFEKHAFVFSKIIDVMNGDMSPHTAIEQIVGTKAELKLAGLALREPLSKTADGEMKTFTKLTNRKIASLHASNLPFDPIIKKTGYAHVYTLRCEQHDWARAGFLWGGFELSQCVGEDGKRYDLSLEFVGPSVGSGKNSYRVITIMSMKKIRIKGFWLAGIDLGLTIGVGGGANIFPFVGPKGSIAFTRYYDEPGAYVGATIGAFQLKPVDK